MLPTSILFRKKRGFAVNVVDDWFNARTKGQFPEVLLDKNSLIFEQLEHEPVRNLLEEHRMRRQNNHKLLFSLIILEQWLRGVRSNFAEDRAAIAA
jgi:asparagine synthase (glutamine-hydrolysing)